MIIIISIVIVYILTLFFGITYSRARIQYEEGKSEMFDPNSVREGNVIHIAYNMNRVLRYQRMLKRHIWFWIVFPVSVPIYLLTLLYDKIRHLLWLASYNLSKVIEGKMWKK